MTRKLPIGDSNPSATSNPPANSPSAATHDHLDPGAIPSCSRKPPKPSRPGPPNHANSFWAPWAATVKPNARRSKSKPAAIPLTISARSPIRRHQLVEHAVEVRRSPFNVQVFSLTGSGLGGKHPTSMHLRKVAIRELVVPFHGRLLAFVDPQVPLRVFAHPMLFDERVFLGRRGLVFAPCIAVVE